MGGLKDISATVWPKRLDKKGSLDGVFTRGFAVKATSDFLLCFQLVWGEKKFTVRRLKALYCTGFQKKYFEPRLWCCSLMLKNTDNSVFSPKEVQLCWTIHMF